MGMLVDEYFAWTIVGVLVVVVAELLWAFFSLRNSHAKLKTGCTQKELLLNSIAEGVYGLDLDGNCTYCNRAALQLLGYHDERDLLGRNLHSLIHHTHADGRSYPAEECRACESFRANREIHLEDEVLWRADGSSFPAEYWSYPLRKGTRLVGAVVSFLDITERKRMETRLREANQELDAFVYTVSHDLRTPISAVIGYADLLQENHREELPAEVVRLLGTIEELGHKMAMLVSDLLDLASAGSLEPPPAPVDANVELAFVLRQLEALRLEQGAIIRAATLPDARVPRTLLQQLFQNLISNALRYAGKEGSPIEVGGERAERLVRFYVRDHGQGISPAERDRVFDVFYRGASGQQAAGSGVGLATVQKIARLYGGRAWIEETPGGGATFWVEMEDLSPPERPETIEAASS